MHTVAVKRAGLTSPHPPSPKRTVAERLQRSTHDSGGRRGSAGPGRPKPALLSWCPVAEPPPCGGLGQSDHPLAELLRGRTSRAWRPGLRSPTTSPFPHGILGAVRVPSRGHLGVAVCGGISSAFLQQPRRPRLTLPAGQPSVSGRARSSQIIWGHHRLPDNPPWRRRYCETKSQHIGPF